MEPPFNLNFLRDELDVVHPEICVREGIVDNRDRRGPSINKCGGCGSSGVWAQGARQCYRLALYIVTQLPLQEGDMVQVAGSTRRCHRPIARAERTDELGPHISDRFPSAA